MATITHAKGGQRHRSHEAPGETNESVRQELLEGLNEDLAGELQAVTMYL